MPAIEVAAAHGGKPGVAGGVVAHQDIGGAVAKIIVGANHRVGGIGAGDLIPVGKGAIAHPREPLSPVALLRNRMSSVPLP
jgi:hypothetical protein